MAEEKSTHASLSDAGRGSDPAAECAGLDTQATDTANTHAAPDDVPSDASKPTEICPLASSHVSDVVLADVPTEVRPFASLSLSDLQLAEEETGAAPSFRIPATPVSPADAAKTVEINPAAGRADKDRGPTALLPGAKIDDFEIVKLLGRGAFGHVYLARQLSLDRLVALKISANRGSEGRTMARLEHQHIVQVFSETVDPEFNQRLLCMQLVPGIGLDNLIGKLGERGARSKERDKVAGVERSEPPVRRESGGSPSARPQPPDGNSLAASPQPPATSWTGAELLEIIDNSGSLPTALDPAALHDREALAKMDAIEATAWFGARLAEALDFAHRNGVLHRDIKPANILVNPYGRPMLADFNISSQPVGSETSGEEMFGGTFAYMSPEHLDAFNPDDPTGHEAVTARSDLYSLGLVLRQLLHGRSSFPPIVRKANLGETLRAIADERRQAGTPCTPGTPDARMTLERTICRCLEPNPEDRFASGAALAAQLNGCQRLREAELKLPAVPQMFQPILRHPFLWLLVLVVVPQLIGSAVNITYNLTQIVTELSEIQKAQFNRLVLAYNAVVYPAAVVIFVVVVRRVWRSWTALQAGVRLPEGEVQIARRKILRLPRWIAGLTAFGWFPGAIIFPLAIQLTAPPLDFLMAAHFFVSFCLSGLIALAYSLCGVEFVVLRGLYPGMWRDAQNSTAVAREELQPVSGQLNRIELLAVSIPLLTAIVFLLFGNVANGTFRMIVASLNVMGMLGFHITSAVKNHLSRVLVALTNTKD
jgi:serine/threonine protein kinase